MKYMYPENRGKIFKTKTLGPKVRWVLRRNLSTKLPKIDTLLRLNVVNLSDNAIQNMLYLAICEHLLEENVLF